MGMFDWYQPVGTFECPVCHTPLHEWQGKDAQCALYVWQQGVAAPVDQACDEECRGLPEVVQADRLPESFHIYSYDCDRHRVNAMCKTIDGVWSETRISEVVDSPTRHSTS
jgi:hypothetical protein